MRISVSQLKCALRCPREWVYKYILKYPEVTADNLHIGRVFHELVEGKPLSQTSSIRSLSTSTPWELYFRRMLAGYAIERKKHAPTFAHELEWLKEAEFKLIIDEIAMNDSGDWWIIERKTAAQSMGLKAYTLAADLQIGMYAVYRKDYAQELWLDPDRFKGCIYMVTYKPNERRKKSRAKATLGEFTESLEEWGERMTSSTESILVEKIDEKGALATRDFGRKVIDYAVKTYDSGNDIGRVPKRLDSCMRYGRACSFFSQCHGREV